MKEGLVFVVVCGNRIVPLVFEITEEKTPEKIKPKKEEEEKKEKQTKEEKCEPCKELLFRHHCPHGIIVTKTPKPPCLICKKARDIENRQYMRSGGYNTSGGYRTRG